VDRLLAKIDFANAAVIVEFGIGNGCVTREILRRMRPDARLISLEINPAFVDVGRRIRDPRLSVRLSCASALGDILRDEGIDRVDAVVSSLPLSIMREEIVDRILDVSRASLSPDGRFHQYQYSLSQYHKLAHRYRNVGVGFTFRNAPPAFVYECTGASGGAPGRVKLRHAMASVYAGTLAAAAMMIRAVQGS